MDKEKIKTGIIGTSMIDLQTKIFFSVTDLNGFENENYYFGFMDSISNRMFGIEGYSDPDEAIDKFVDMAFRFAGNRCHEIRA